MVDTKIVQNYADALMRGAEKQDSVEEVSQQLGMLSKLLTNSIEVSKYLNSPIIGKEQKKNLLEKMYKHTELTNILKEFLQVLIKNQRFELLKDIVVLYQQKVKSKHSIKQVEIISAKTLSDQALKLVTDFLSTYLQQKIKLDLKQDKSIIGGVIMKYDSKLIDYSISGALNKISNITRQN